jgi:hypothetical protein
MSGLDDEHSRGGTALVPYGTNEVDLAEIQKFLLEHGSGAPVGTRLKHVKGVWLLGDEEEKADVTKSYVAHLGQIRVGWIKLVNNEVVKRIEGRLSQLPHRTALDEPEMFRQPGDPWKPSTAMIMRDDAGDLFHFSSLSWGGRWAVIDLLNKYNARARRAPRLFPMVLLASEKRKDPQRNTVYDVPIFRVVDWQLWDPARAADFRDEDMPPYAPAVDNIADSTPF